MTLGNVKIVNDLTSPIAVNGSAILFDAILNIPFLTTEAVAFPQQPPRKGKIIIKYDTILADHVAYKPKPVS